MHIPCLEQGPHIPDSQLPSRRDDYEPVRYAEFSCDLNVRKLKYDYPINVDDSCFTPVNFNAVGGSTINILGHWPRMKPSNFRTNTLDGVAEDWPVDYATLAGGLNTLGWHWWPSDVAILSVDRDGRQKCVNAGTCDLGCAAGPEGAKGGTSFTYWPMLEYAGVELRTECRVSEILVDQETRFATGVIYYGADGQVHEQKAELVIVACNVTGTPRLLLNSASTFSPTVWQTDLIRLVAI